jgi:hypothetical protein
MSSKEEQEEIDAFLAFAKSEMLRLGDYLGVPVSLKARAGYMKKHYPGWKRAFDAGVSHGKKLCILCRRLNDD